MFQNGIPETVPFVTAQAEVLRTAAYLLTTETPSGTNFDASAVALRVTARLRSLFGARLTGADYAALEAWARKGAAATRRARRSDETRRRNKAEKLAAMVEAAVKKRQATHGNTPSPSTQQGPNRNTSP